MRLMVNTVRWAAARDFLKCVVLLLDHLGARDLPHENITIALWKRLQRLTIAVEGELKTSDGRLMGRLDLLLTDVDSKGNTTGWLLMFILCHRLIN